MARFFLPGEDGLLAVRGAVHGVRDTPGGKGGGGDLGRRGRVSEESVKKGTWKETKR